MSSLYIEHFRLSEAPFGITPNGKFFFEGQARGAILDALQHAVLDDDGIIVVVGEVGSGKTMLCRMLADRLPRDKVDLVYLANPSFGPREILQSMVADWGLDVSADQPVLVSIQAALMQRHEQGRRVVVLIDEAQAMPAESLEEIKLLSNLETAQRKLLQIVLFGQPELDDLLAQPRLRQVRDRVVHRFDLQPLDACDASAYIDHRLRRAGWQAGALFEARALRQLVAASAGRIRALHLLADKALLAAFAQGERQISHAHVRRAIEEFKGQGRSSHPWAMLSSAARSRLPAIGLALALLGMGAALGYGLGYRAVPQHGDAVPLLPAAIEQPASSAEAAVRVAPSVADMPASAAAVQPSMALLQDGMHARYAHIPAPLREAVQRTRAVFDDPAQEFWTLQIGIADTSAGALNLMGLAQPGTEMWIHDRLYNSQPGGRNATWTVYTGRFSTRDLALQALQSLPAQMRSYRPLARTLSGLRAEPYPERAPS